MKSKTATCRSTTRPNSQITESNPLETHLAQCHNYLNMNLDMRALSILFVCLSSSEAIANTPPLPTDFHAGQTREFYQALKREAARPEDEVRGQVFGTVANRLTGIPPSMTSILNWTRQLDLQFYIAFGEGALFWNALHWFLIKRRKSYPIYLVDIIKTKTSEGTLAEFIMRRRFQFLSDLMRVLREISPEARPTRINSHSVASLMGFGTSDKIQRETLFTNASEFAEYFRWYASRVGYTVSQTPCSQRLTGGTDVASNPDLLEAWLNYLGGPPPASQYIESALPSSR